jgi:hypothetical protein
VGGTSWGFSYQGGISWVTMPILPPFSTFDDPYLVFAFCYLASHFGLGLISEECIQEVMAFFEEAGEIARRNDRPRRTHIPRKERCG